MVIFAVGSGPKWGGAIIASPIGSRNQTESGMTKKMNLSCFNLYHYLKEKHADNFDSPFFLADHNTYKSHEIRFPFRSFTYGIGLTYTGSGDAFRIGTEDYLSQPGSLITIGPGIVSQWTGYESTHDTIYFTEDLFKNTLKGSFLKTLPFFLPGGNHVIVLGQEDKARIGLLFQMLRQFRVDTDIITGLVYSLLMLVVKYHHIQNDERPKSFSSRQRIVANFKSLLCRLFLEKKDVAFYASQLHITPKYLSEVLLAESGKTAKTLIDEHISLEARSLLRQTDMTVQEICYSLGYADTSYFTKVFKRQEGMTPMKYRQL
jgi:AraC family transcriptional activator of pobA